MKVLYNVQRLLRYRQGATAALGFFLGAVIAVSLLQSEGSWYKQKIIDSTILLPSKIGNIDVLHNIAAGGSRRSAGPTVAVVFHGCNNDAATWRDGPIERELLAAIMRARFRVVAISSNFAEAASAGDENASHRCWDTSTLPERNADVRRVMSVIAAMRKLYPGLRFIGVGASSGGAFVSLLAAHRPDLFDAIAVYISPLHPAFISTIDGTIRGDSAAPARLPAVLAVHMGERDQATAMVLREQRQQLLLAASRSPCAAARTSGAGPEACVGLLTAVPRDISAAAVAALLPSRISPDAATELVKRLEAAGVVVASSGSVHADSSGSFDRSFRVATQPRLRSTKQLVVDFCASLQPAASFAVGSAKLARCEPGICYPDDVLLDIVPTSAAPSTIGSVQSKTRGAMPVAAPGVAEAQAKLAHWLLELLNEAYAEHEMTAQHAQEVANWLSMHANASAALAVESADVFAAASFASAP